MYQRYLRKLIPPILNSLLSAISETFDIKNHIQVWYTNAKLVGTNDIANLHTETRFRFDT